MAEKEKKSKKVKKKRKKECSQGEGLYPSIF